MKKIDNISIIGMGALGVLYGDFFAERLGMEAISFIADKERINRYRREGVYCNGKRRDFRFQDAAKAEQKAELLIFTVKATALESAIELARPFIGEDTIILSALNGISSEEIIASKLGGEHLLYCVVQGMDAVKIGNELTYAHIGTVFVGLPEAERSKADMLATVVELFERTALPFVAEEDILRRLWCKWMLNVGVNQVVMVEEGTYGTVQQTGTARELMIAAMREVIAIAEKASINVSEKDLQEYISLTDTLNPDGMPSMRQDGLARRPSEIELFAAEVIRKAEQYGVEVPVNRMLYERVRKLEQQY